MEDNKSGNSGDQTDGKDVSISDFHNEDAPTEVCESVKIFYIALFSGVLLKV